MQTENKYKIAYYITTNIQHIPPVVRLIPYLGGIVITRNPDIYNHFTKKYSNFNIPIFLVKKTSQVRKVITENRIRLVVYTGFNAVYRGKSVQIFHGGLSDKNYVESLKILLYDLVLFPGEKTKDKIDRVGYLKHLKEWKIVGYPKFDPLASHSLDVTPIFNNGRRTILYAPTVISKVNEKDIIRFSKYGESSLNVWAKQLISELHNEYNIIVKYHSTMEREPGDIFEQIDQLIKDLNATEHVVTIVDDNILHYMYQADIMISDISTACYEWFHFNRPIIFANPAPGKYFPSNDISSNTYAWNAGDIINEQNDICRLVKENLEVDKFKEVRNRIFNYTVYKPDGNAAERQANAIIELYRKNEKTPYFWLIFSSWVWGRSRRLTINAINQYYKWFKKDKLGK